MFVIFFTIRNRIEDFDGFPYVLDKLKVLFRDLFYTVVSVKPSLFSVCLGEIGLLINCNLLELCDIDTVLIL